MESPLKIVELRSRCVAIPLNAVLRSNTGVHPGYFVRTVLEVLTDEGVTGLGEVGGGDQRAALAKLTSRVVGLDPFQINVIRQKTLRNTYFMSNARLYAAIEMACLDIQGKVLNRPVSDLLGGRLRESVPFIAYLFWRYDRPGGGDDMRAEDVADHCEELAANLGVRSMKLKAGVMGPGEEARVLELCRKRLGWDFGLRIDPNGTWSVSTAVRIGRRLEDIQPEWFEDPAWGLEGLAAVRRAIRVPIGTNMYPARFDDLGPGIRLGAVDTILTDLHYWEGMLGVKELCAVCRAFGISAAMHSGTEFGIELAAMLHTASTIPEMVAAADAHYHYLSDDIIAGGKLAYRDGHIAVPKGPGLGVELDAEKMDHYERYFEKHGDYYARFRVDPRRPDWFPVIGST
ncbi:enolase C-terminal domain-like protein [Peristeroidobacter agariperforans]|uniref:enolase C-terminal domain-like protein n=1 Tax=Peristeroidobacter agariperforans TaxID=268404 RepID=UPI0018E5A31B|nr:enolase C-terminal domain-like protein [Peristeroidobacter agariperforans]